MIEVPLSVCFSLYIKVYNSQFFCISRRQCTLNIHTLPDDLGCILVQGVRILWGVLVGVVCYCTICYYKQTELWVDLCGPTTRKKTATYPQGLHCEWGNASLTSPVLVKWKLHAYCVMISAYVYMCVMRPANERRRYNVTSSFIGWTHAQNEPCTSN